MATGARTWFSRNQFKPSLWITCEIRSCQAGWQCEETQMCSQRITTQSVQRVRPKREEVAQGKRWRVMVGWLIAPLYRSAKSVPVLSDGMQFLFLCFLEIYCPSLAILASVMFGQNWFFGSSTEKQTVCGAKPGTLGLLYSPKSSLGQMRQIIPTASLWQMRTPKEGGFSRTRRETAQLLQAAFSLNVLRDWTVWSWFSLPHTYMLQFKPNNSLLFQSAVGQSFHNAEELIKFGFYL